MREKVIEIGRDSAWYLFSNVACALISFTAVPIFTRIFSPSEYGIYSLIATAIMLGSPIFFLWLTNAIVRFYPEYEKRGELRVFFSTTLKRIPHFLLVTIGIVIPVVAVLVPIGEYKLLIGLGIGVFGLYTVFRVLLGFCRAMQMARQYAIFMVFVQIGRYIGGAVLVSRFGMRVEGPFWGWLGALIIAIPLEIWVLRLWRRVEKSSYSRSLERKIISYGAPLILVNILSEILTAADRYMVQGFWGSKQVGLYSVVYTLVTSLEAILASIIMLGATPVVMKVYEHEGEERTIRLISNISRYFLMILVPAIIGIWVLDRRIVSVITSPSFMDARAAVFPLTLGVFLNNLMWVPFLSFQVKKRTNVSIVPVGISAVFNLLLNVLLIPLFGPKFGFVGAAWATLASYMLCFALIAYFGGKYMRWEFPWTALLRISLSGAVMGLVVFFLNKVLFGRWYGLLTLVVIGACVYFVFMVLIGGIKRSELSFAHSNLRRAFSKLTAKDSNMSGRS